MPSSSNAGPERAQWRRAALLSLALCLVLPLPAAAQNSWTDSLFGFFELTPEQEVQIAQQEHPKIVEQFGGEYDNPAVTAYVNSLVNDLGKRSDRPDIHYRVTVLNSPIVNAFALPAGYLYISRGLLALAENEAEVAGVLAHEIGHVTARHTAQRYGRARASALGVGALNLVLQASDLGSLAGIASQAAQIGAALYIQSYSRDQEFQADSLGIQTLGRTGYQPYAMASFLDKLQNETKLQATIAGHPEAADQFSLMSTHPRTADRVQRAIEQAPNSLGARQPMVARDTYLRKIDGLLVDDDPRHGLIQGNAFVHPVLKLRFEVPEGFRLLNGATAVNAIDNKGGLIRFDTAEPGYTGGMPDYLRTVWAKEQPLSGVESINLNGLQAATGYTQLKAEQGTVDARLMAIRWAPESVFRFLFISPPERTAELEPAYRATAFSFRRISDAEAAAVKPRRIAIATVQSGDTAESLAQRMAYSSYQVERLRTLNGMKPDQRLQPGQLVKLVVQGE